MKKLLALLLVLLIIFPMVVSCGCNNNDEEEKKEEEKEKEKEKEDEIKITLGINEIAMITDKGNIDDKSFNQGTWEGIEAFVKKHKVNTTAIKYYKPEAATDDAYLASIELAISGGAKVVVTPGYLFESAVYAAQYDHPNIKFILLDGEPHTPDYKTYQTEPNTACLVYAEEESGYLAGYAAVKDGFTKLGFMGGMAVPAVRAFGYGFLQGAEAAAKDMNLSDGALTVTYHYTGNFDENDTNKATAATMYQQGVEVIFACGGSVGKSVMAAAAEANKKVIGVDVDQRYDSPTVITSATKGLAPSIIAALESVYINKNFSEYAGKTTTFEAKNKGVGLPTTVIGVTNGNAFDRFTSFNKDAYDTVFATLANDTVNPIRDITVAAETGYATADELKTGLSLVKVVPTVR
ncbi:MAG TPA: BMP family ABC transporter substrate-binding protein [Clostridiales bacterium]|nr:BMP family ABC transporter substrate-binding protein [Clostridiales bacterium]